MTLHSVSTDACFDNNALCQFGLCCSRFSCNTDNDVQDCRTYWDPKQNANECKIIRPCVDGMLQRSDHFFTTVLEPSCTSTPLEDAQMTPSQGTYNSSVGSDVPAAVVQAVADAGLMVNGNGKFESAMDSLRTMVCVSLGF